MFLFGFLVLVPQNLQRCLCLIFWYLFKFARLNTAGIGIIMFNTAVVGKSFYYLLAALVVGSLSQQMPQLASAQPYNFQIGYTQCYSCQAGTYIGAEGSGDCIACEPGYYQDSNGSSVCSECPEGLTIPVALVSS